MPLSSGTGYITLLTVKKHGSSCDATHCLVARPLVSDLWLELQPRLLKERSTDDNALRIPS
jgi:hypothetical protein